LRTEVRRLRTDCGARGFREAGRSIVGEVVLRPATTCGITCHRRLREWRDSTRGCERLRSNHRLRRRVRCGSRARRRLPVRAIPCLKAGRGSLQRTGVLPERSDRCRVDRPRRRSIADRRAWRNGGPELGRTGWERVSFYHICLGRILSWSGLSIEWLPSATAGTRNSRT
jgi:hypothetical protein